jgi:transposase
MIQRALIDNLQHIRRVVLETGRMANWLYSELSQRGLPMVCIDARQAHAVLSQMHNKTDENDAAMLAELARTGFYKRIEVKSRVAQERRALLRAREVAIKSRMNVENTIRGLLATFGICLPKHLKTYDQRVRKALEGQPDLLRIILPLLHLRTEALRQAAALTKDMVRQARVDGTCRRLMTIPGVGPVSAVTYVSTIDTADWFARSRSVGAYIGLTSRRYQSGDVDYGGRISRRGDRMLRTVLSTREVAHLGGAKPGEHRQSYMRESVSACRARRRIRSRVLLYSGILSASSLNRRASSASRSSKVSVCLTRRRIAISRTNHPMALFARVNRVCPTTDNRIEFGRSGFKFG